MKERLISKNKNIFCPNCGREDDNNSSFCRHCGVKLEIEGYPDKKESLGGKDEDATKVSPQGKKVSVDKTWFIILIMVGVLIVTIVILGSQSSAPQSSSNQATSNQITSNASGAVTQKSAAKPVTSNQTNRNIQNQPLQNVPANKSENLSTSFISQIEPAIVLVVCFPPNYSGGDFDYGSGVSVDYSKTTYIETNYHVYNGENVGGGSPTCFAYYPGPAPDFSINSNSGGYQLVFSGYNYNPDTSEDVVDFTLGQSTSSSTPLASIPVINDTSLTGIGSGCSDVNNGDSVTIFGYPASGNYLDVSETVTQGTISGQTPGPIYKFDGAIDHGNSGGLAVLDKSSCDLGIPTLGVSGLTAGTGYIQSVSLARQPVTLSNDQICQNQYGANSDYTGNNSQGGLICGCGSGYTWNVGDTACVALPAETGYQVCGNAYPNETWDGTYGSNGQFNCVCDDGYTWNGSQCVNAQ